MKRNLFSALNAAVIAIVAFGASTLHAQTAWDGGGGNSDYSNNVNWATNTIPGNANNNGALIGSGSTQTVVYSTATSYTSNGTSKANSLLVGTGSNGNGSLTLNGSAGTLTFGGDDFANAAWIGTTGGTVNTTGSVTVTAGTLSITGGPNAAINLGVSTGGNNAGAKSGTLIINGGRVNVASRLLVGANHVDTVGTLTISSGLLNMQATGTTNAGLIRFGVGTNTVNLDGGTVILTGFHTSAASSARSTIFFNSTTLRANASNADFMNGTTADANSLLKDGGLVMDTNTFDVTINDALSNETGHNGLLRKEGLGTLTLSATNTYTGATTVNGGTLLVYNKSGSGTGSGNVTVVAGATLGGTGAISGSVAFDSDAFLHIADLDNPLVVADSGNTFGGNFGIANLAGINWDSLDLNTTYTALTTDQVFSSSDIENFWLANAAPVGTGRQAYLTNGSLAFIAVPEPGTVALLACGGIGAAAMLRRRRRA